MENPHEERQAMLLARIIKNADKLHEAIIEMNKAVAVSRARAPEINTANEDIVIASELFANYRRNVAYNLTATSTTETSLSE
ncbi:DASH complex subunit dad4 domain-containing protein [Rhizoctonia solani AG-1 IA]|uniref:DASH complex subunit DAD4 n=1 Tax=Thanatephorus cucumeris (strain AG1-IA) TaxID=983506 RepID=L8X845_THACA|nr:DASH complex subunit dad4 domain-containing protein [Rhizoctonia solani AG-1 IA]